VASGAGDVTGAFVSRAPQPAKNESVAWILFKDGIRQVMLRPGVDSFSVTFNNAGTFTYFCKVHAYYIGQSWVGMSGTVLVVPLTAADAVGSLSAVSYASLALAIVALVVAIYAVVRHKSEIQKTA